MILRGVALPIAVAGTVATAAAQTTGTATSVATLLQGGYEVRTAFADTSGGAYIILQRGTSAYMCHSSPRQICEKLN